MIEITQHIENLLLTHDCVIVPGLGGFVAQDCPATYVEEEGLFLPPYRSVSFNHSLTMNDGLLANEVATGCNISYADALNTLKYEVNQILQTLHKTGKYNFAGIGELTTNEDHLYEFTPLPCGIVAPSLYGLDGFYIMPTEIADIAEETEVEESAETEDDTITLSIPMRIVRYAAAVAVAAVFFFLCLAPVNPVSHFSKTSEASMWQQVWALVSTPFMQADPQPAKDSKAAAQTNNPSQEAATAEKSSAAMADEPALPYTIVMMSAVPEVGAQQIIEELKATGYPDARMVDDCNMIRVVYGSYANKAEAQKVLCTNREKCSAFEHAWIYALP